MLVATRATASFCFWRSRSAAFAWPLSLALRCPRLAFRFLFRGLLLTLGFLLGRLLRLFLLLGKLRLLRLKLGPLCRESAIDRFR